MIVGHEKLVTDFQQAFIGFEKLDIVQYFFLEPRLVHDHSTVGKPM
jgi:hypothetical protein